MGRPAHVDPIVMRVPRQGEHHVGGGVERPVSGQLALRVIGDYLRTDFYDSAGAVKPQNNLRLTVSFVFRLKERAHRSTQLR